MHACFVNRLVGYPEKSFRICSIPFNIVSSHLFTSPHILSHALDIRPNHLRYLKYTTFVELGMRIAIRIVQKKPISAQENCNPLSPILSPFLPNKNHTNHKSVPQGYLNQDLNVLLPTHHVLNNSAQPDKALLVAHEYWLHHIPYDSAPSLV